MVSDRAILACVQRFRAPPLPFRHRRVQRLPDKGLFSIQPKVFWSRSSTAGCFPRIRQNTAATSYITGSKWVHMPAITLLRSRISWVRSMAWKSPRFSQRE